MYIHFVKLFTDFAVASKNYHLIRSNVFDIVPLKTQPFTRMMALSNLIHYFSPIRCLKAHFQKYHREIALSNAEDCLHNRIRFESEISCLQNDNRFTW